jgi:hypothetical protein
MPRWWYPAGAADRAFPARLSGRAARHGVSDDGLVDIVGKGYDAGIRYAGVRCRKTWSRCRLGRRNAGGRGGAGLFQATRRAAASRELAAARMRALSLPERQFVQMGTCERRRTTANGCARPPVGGRLGTDAARRARRCPAPRAALLLGMLAEQRRRLGARGRRRRHPHRAAHQFHLARGRDAAGRSRCRAPSPAGWRTPRPGR